MKKNKQGSSSFFKLTGIVLVITEQILRIINLVKIWL